MGLQEQGLHTALINMRTQLAAETLPRGCMLAPQALISTALLDHIVNLARNRKVLTLESLREQITWAFLDLHGAKIINLVRQFCPPISTSPFTMEPLQRQTNGPANEPGPLKAKKQVKCGSCGQFGHNSESLINKLIELHQLI
jgi:hypothetical protein